MSKTLKTLVVFDSAGTPPENQDYTHELQTPDWQAERNVLDSLKHLGHQVSHLGIYDDVRILFDKITKEKPDIIFNLADHFMNESAFDKHLAGIYELLRIPYTGSPPSALLLAKNKGLTKTILSFHGIDTPKFQVFTRDRKIPKTLHLNTLNYPLIVKALREEASYGISQKSLVTNNGDLLKRIDYVHNVMKQDAIVEEFVEGRELYVSLLGNKDPIVFPLREMIFSNSPEGEAHFATYKAKWDEDYRKRWGIENIFASLPSDVVARIEQMAKKVCEILYLRGYARLDLRLAPDKRIFVIEANANPHIAKDEDFALSAKKGGLGYDQLIQKIIELGFEEHKKFFGE